MEYSNNSRWWETYLVRYITGSVVGAVIVYIIADSNLSFPRFFVFQEVAFMLPVSPSAEQ
jgi:hypothetical protein